MKLRNKLYLDFTIFLILIFLITGTALNILNQFKHNMNEVVQNNYEEVRSANIVRYEFTNTSRMFRDLIILGKDKETLDQIMQQIERSRENTLLALSDLDKKVITSETEQLVLTLKLRYEEYIELQKTIETLVYEGRKEEAIDLLTDPTPREEMFRLTNQIVTIEEQAMRDTLAQTATSYRQALRVFAILIILGVLIGLGIIFISMRKIVGKINTVTDVINGISSFDAMDNLPRINIAATDEIGQIAKAFNEMACALEERIKQEKEYHKEIQENSWLKSNVGEVSTMFQGVKNIKIFCDELITKLAPMVGGKYGVIYLLQGEEEQKYLKKLATYAFDGSQIDSSDFQLGEGLVGQCALEKKEILLEQVPDNYIKVASGLGSAAPKSILILPVKFDEQVLAVVELASLDEFSPLQVELLRRVLNTLGITINRIANYMQVEKLLKESQIFTEELQTQSEELQLQQEELTTFNEKLEEQYKGSKQKTVELEEVKLSLEEQARQLALSSQYKTDFLSNMSHELRTPLNSLLVLAQILAENSAGNLTAKQVEYAGTILSSGVDLLNLINDILDLAKVESGKMEVYQTEVKLKDIEDCAKRSYLPVAQTKVLEFSVQFDDDLPEVIYTDEQKLRQIVNNLLANAFKFTKKGSVLLQIKKAPKHTAATPMLAISVVDTGIGIPGDKFNIIFDEFLQADGTTSRKFGGTGLGLAISKKYAQLLGGFIRLESQEGKGSTFTLFVPVNIAGASIKDAAASEVAVGLEEPASADVNQLAIEPAQGPLEGRKILIVDDDMRNVFALTAILENHKMDVLFAVDGKAGIKTLQENPDIDLVLMDIMMPEMDGYEAMKYIRQIPKFQTLPIIALTAKAMKYDREKCINAGASDYISKPVNVKQLLSLIKVWLY